MSPRNRNRKQKNNNLHKKTSASMTAATATFEESDPNEAGEGPSSAFYALGNNSVDANFRNVVFQEIKEFGKSFDDCLEFPPTLTKEQRAFVHEYVKHFGLTSRSFGHGNRRFITVFRRIKSNTSKIWFCLTQESRILLQQYFAKYDVKNSENLSSIFDSLTISKGIMADSNIKLGGILRFDSAFNYPPKACTPKSIQIEKCKLPIFKYRTEILNKIDTSQVIIVNGETGSGKTTQVPQYILEKSHDTCTPCRIICTQPRRLATVAISQRVAQERGENIGHTVGYQIRLEGRYNRFTNLIYATSGCFLRSLMTNMSQTFSGITHIIIDEIHERDKNTDFILISLREELMKNKKLKIILMSATMDINLLSNYFGGCSIITVPGQCHEVKIYYLEEILYCTEYRTKVMMDYLKLWQRNVGAGNYDNQIYNGLDDDDYDDDNDDDCDNEDDTVPDEETQKYVDYIIENIYKCTPDIGDQFEQLCYLIESENISINVKHSISRKTPLIAAVQMNNLKYVEKFLSLNADIKCVDSNNKTALNYANRECYTLLSEFEAKRKQHKNCNEKKSEKENDQEIDVLIRAYEKQFCHADNGIGEDDVDYELLKILINMVHVSDNRGSILVFLPGYNDIVTLKDLLIGTLIDGTYNLFFLHSNMKIEDQQRALKPCVERKIILSTNIAETSITFPDVVFVIDSGRVKQNSYDSVTGASYLKSIWISKACAQQRSGRAGRTQPGICYRMYSRQRYNKMEEFPIPEFLRIPLTEICLYTKVINDELSIADHLANALNPPSKLSVVNAVKTLKIIGALDDDENLTILGQHLVDFPVEVQLGKCLLFALWMKCLDPILTIVAYHSVKDPFVLPSDRKERGIMSHRRKTFSANSFSDHIGIINLFKQWRKSKNNRYTNEGIFCSENYLTKLSMDMIQATRKQIYDTLNYKYHIDETKHNLNSNNWHIIYACLLAGLYPNICRVDRTKVKITSRQEDLVYLHPSSSLRPSGKNDIKQCIKLLNHDWIVFFEKTRIKRWGNIRYNTVMPSILIALFCGRMNHIPVIKNGVVIFNKESQLNEEHQNEIEDDFDAMNSVLKIDDWIEFCITNEDKEFLNSLRMKINNLFVEFLEQTTKNIHKRGTKYDYSHKLLNESDELLLTLERILAFEIDKSPSLREYFDFYEQNRNNYDDSGL